MGKIKRTWFIICMMGIVAIGVSSCMKMDPELQNSITKKLDTLSKLSDEMTLAYKKYKSGELNVEEFQNLTRAIKTTIENTKIEVLALKEEGVGWADLIWATILGMISRGVPSKGPLGSLFGMFSKRREGT